MGEIGNLWGAPREWARDLAAMTVVGAFLGAIGPFGSFYGGGIEMRVAYWISNMWIGFIIMALAARLSVRIAAPLDLPIWFTLAVGVAIAALPLAGLLGLFSAVFWPPNHGHMTDLAVMYGQTLVISEPAAFAYYFLADRGWRRAAPTPPQHGAIAPPRPSLTVGGFVDRLPPRLGRELLCLQMEDHFVRAHTLLGSDLILTPLKDAIAELGATDGLQVHRSWWVAREAVAEPVMRGRNLSLRLRNGIVAPVSRGSISTLRAAGWLALGGHEP